MARKTLTTALVKKFIPARKSKSRKGENGIVLVVGGKGPASCVRWAPV